MSSNDNENEPSETKSSKICPFCKKENPLDFIFCTNCGNNLDRIMCYNCYSRIPITSIFCAYCGVNLKEHDPLPINNSNPPPSSNPFYNPQSPPAFQPYYYPYSPPYNYPPYGFYNNLSPPKWWNLPVFFIIYCMFGLLILSVMVIAFISAFIGMTQIGIQGSIYLDIATKIIQLLLILFAIKFFKGLRPFFSKRENVSPNGPKLDVNLQRSPNIVIKLFFLLFFIFFLLAVDLYSSLIVEFFKGFFGSQPSASPYDFIYNSLGNDFFLIFFWVAIFAPLHEEILFRGILQQGLDRSGTSDFSHYIIQGTTFAFMHLAGDILDGGTPDVIIVHMISTFLFAISATYLRKKFKSLIYPILLHSISNGLSIAFSFLTTDYFTVNQLNLITNAIYILPLVFIVLIPLILYLLSIWKPKRPLSLKETKFSDFIGLILLLALILNIIQYAFLFMHPIQTQFVYILVLTLVSFVVFILWGQNVIDITWNELKSIK